MINGIEKYYRILKKISRQEKKTNLYSAGYFYNKEKKENWEKKLKESYKEENNIINQLTQKQKIKILLKTEVDLL